MKPAQVEPEVVERDGKKYKTIREGKATIFVAHDETKEGSKDEAAQKVFYNPIQQYNRDLSVLAIKTYGEQMMEKRRAAFEAKAAKPNKKRKRGQENGETVSAEPKPEEPEQQIPQKREHTPQFKILDALSASGLRALRYAHELPFVTDVTANDLSASAADSIKFNVEQNELNDKITVSNDDAMAHMYRSIADDLSNRDRQGNPGTAHKYDVVDLDPYGSGATFFDAAVQSVRNDGGLLCITCTDSAVWAGHSYCEKSFSLYGGIPTKGMHSHEVGLRLVLHAIATSAARYGLNIEPLLSLSIDFYTKFFIKVTKSQQAVKFLGSKTMLAYTCDQGCGAWETQPLMKARPTPNKSGTGTFYKFGMILGPTADKFCSHCGFKTHLNGPMYAGHIHSPDFVEKLLDQIPQADPATYGTLPRLEGMLRTALEEHLPGTPAPEDVGQRDAEAAVVDQYPFFFIPSRVASVLSCASPPYDMLRGALLHLGYRATRSHCKPGSIKTDAPWSTIWWVMTEWVRQKSPVKTSRFTPTMPGYKILRDAGLLDQTGASEEKTSAQDTPMADAEPATVPATDKEATKTNGSVGKDYEESNEKSLRKTLVFNDDLASLGRRKEPRLVRYPSNPRANWGPMSKAVGR